MSVARKIRSPNLFVVGAAKSGTSSLHAFLGQHPAIFMSPLKEPHFFSDDLRLKNFSPGYQDRVRLDVDKYVRAATPPPRHIAFIENQDQYLQLFRGAGDAVIIGESSPGYLYSNRAAQRILQFNSRAKIIMVLRQPVERAYSHYLMDLRDSEIADIGFVAAFEQDLAAPRKGWGNSHLYLELGLYAEQVRRYLDRFPRQQIKICLYEDLQRDPVRFMEELFRFLGVDASPRNVAEFAAQENAAALPRFAKLNRLIRTSGLAQDLSSLIPRQMRRYLKQSLLTRRRVPSLQHDEFEQVLGYFRNDIAKLSALLGRDLQHWSQPSH